MRKVNIGVVGCGNISGIYFSNLTKVFLNTNVYACADLDRERAEAAKEKYGIEKIMTFEEMLKCDEIEIILNLTTPKSHYPICKKALEAGKHVYVEKPLSLTYEQGAELKKIADEKGLLLGGAPDTFLGAGISTCRKLIDDGYIGKPIGATAFMMCKGHESWHPDPEFYYEKGGGPMFDMGPYYLTALVNLLGSVDYVCGMNTMPRKERIITSEKKYGKVIPVETDTHVSGMLKFSCGAVASIITSFDVIRSNLPRMEIYGTKGTLLVPDPNTFGGPVMLATADGSGFKEIPLTHIYAENSRGVGVSDMADCVINGGKNRAGAELTLHVLEIMTAFKASEENMSYYKMKSKCQRPEPMSSDNIKGTVLP